MGNQIVGNQVGGKFVGDQSVDGKRFDGNPVDGKPVVDEAPNSQPQSGGGVERRRDFRFATHNRVEYRIGPNRHVTFMGNLSIHGMFVEKGEALTPKDVVEFTLHLEQRAPLVVRGEVMARTVHGNKPGAHIRFVDEGQSVAQELKQYIAAVIVPKIEKSVGEAWPAFEKLMGFAREQVHASKPANDIDLSPANPRSMIVLERAVSSAAEAMPVLRELELMIAAGSSVGGSEELKKFGDLLGRLRPVDAMESAVVQRIEVLRADLERKVRSELAGQQRAVQHEASLLAQRENELAQFEQRLKNEEAQQEIKRRELEGLAAANETRRASVDALSEQLRAKSAALEDETKENEKRRVDESRRLAEDSARLERERGELEGERQALRSHLKNAEEREREVADLRAMLEAQRLGLERETETTTRELEAKRAELERHAERLKQEKQSFESLREGVDKQSEDLARTLDQMQQQVVSDGVALDLVRDALTKQRNALAAERSKLDSEKHELEERAAQLKYQQEQLERRNEDQKRLAEQLAVQESQLGAAAIQSHELNKESELAGRRLAEQGQVLEARARFVEEQARELAQRSRDLETLREQINQRSNNLPEREDLALDLQAAVAASQVLESQLLELRNELMQADARRVQDVEEYTAIINTLRKDEEARQIEVEAIKAELQQAYDKMADTAASGASVAELQQLDERRRELEALKRSIDVRQQALEADQQRISEDRQTLEAQILQQRSERESHIENAAKLQIAKEQLEAARAALDEDRSAINDQRLQLQAAQEQLQQQAESNSDAAQQLQQLLQRNAELEEHKRRLEQAARESRDRAAEVLTERRERAEVLSRQLEEARHEADGLRERLLAAENTATVLQSQAMAHQDAEKLAQALTEERDALRLKLEQLEGEGQKLREADKAAKKGLEHERLTLTKQVQDLEARRKELAAMRETIERETQARGKQVEADLSRIRDERSALDGDRQLREQGWMQIHAERATLNRERAALVEQLTQLDGQRRQLLDAMSQRDAQGAVQTAELDRMRRDLETAKLEHNELERLRVESLATKDRLRSAEQDLERAQRDVAALKVKEAELEHTRVDATGQKERIRLLDKELERVRAELQSAHEELRVAAEAQLVLTREVATLRAAARNAPKLEQLVGEPPPGSRPAALDPDKLNANDELGRGEVIPFAKPIEQPPVEDAEPIASSRSKAPLLAAAAIGLVVVAGVVWKVSQTKPAETAAPVPPPVATTVQQAPATLPVAPPAEVPLQPVEKKKRKPRNSDELFEDAFK